MSESSRLYIRSFSFVLLASSNSTLPFDPEVLSRTGAIPDTWKLVGALGTTPNLIGSVYNNGVIIKSEDRKIIIEENFAPDNLADAEFPALVPKLLPLISYLSFEAVGLNFTATILDTYLDNETSNAARNRVSIHGNEPIFPNTAEYKFLVPVNEWQIQLSMQFGSFIKAANDKEKLASLFNINCHYNLPEQSDEDIDKTILALAENWADTKDIAVSIIDSFIDSMKCKEGA